MKYRRIAYVVVITVGLLLIFSEPIKACADFFGYYIPDVYDEITTNVKETNSILQRAFDFAQTSPYAVINSIPAGSSNYKIAQNIIDASKTMALVVATLLLFVDFVRKSINFEWASKWENILLFLIKIIILKQVIQNADIIIGTIYSMFNSINTAFIGGNLNLLPDGEEHVYTTEIDLNIIREAQKQWWEVLIDIANKAAGTDTYTYHLSGDAIRMFYPEADFPTETTFSSYDHFTGSFATPTHRIVFMPSWEIAKLYPIFLIMKAIAYVIFVIVIGRVFELTIYTVFAPLPLATFASETTHDVAKNFLKNYIAVVIQLAVIAMMFILYSAMNLYIIKWITDNYGADATTKLMNLVILAVLGLGVVKSGTWAKKICGIA